MIYRPNKNHEPRQYVIYEYIHKNNEIKGDVDLEHLGTFMNGAIDVVIVLVCTITIFNIIDIL